MKQLLFIITLFTGLQLYSQTIMRVHRKSGAVEYLPIAVIDSVTHSVQNLPVLTTTLTTDSITNVSAVSGGIISSEGGRPVFARGVCWNTAPAPTISNTYFIEEGAGPGTFNGSIKPLKSNTTYYVRAFAASVVGISYGNELSFVTKSCNPSQVNLPDFSGIYNNTNEKLGTSPYGPYTTRVIQVTPLTATTGEITVENIWDVDDPATPAYDGWKPIRFRLDWTDPNNPIATLDEQTGIGDGGTLSSTYSGREIAVRAYAGQPGTFNYCDQVLVLKLQLGIVGLGWFTALYEVKLER
jgi:hypothetical protein